MIGVEFMILQVEMCFFVLLWFCKLLNLGFKKQLQYLHLAYGIPFLAASSSHIFKSGFVNHDVLNFRL